MIHARPDDSQQARHFVCQDEAATGALAARLAPLLRPGDVIALWGDLGAGKTTFARFLIRALAGSEIEVPSPTYTLVQTYMLADFELWHFDLYRLASPAEVEELAFEDASTGVALIEWPERAGAFLPGDRLDIRLEALANSRSVTLCGGPGWKGRLDDSF